MVQLVPSVQRGGVTELLEGQVEVAPRGGNLCIALSLAAVGVFKLDVTFVLMTCSYLIHTLPVVPVLSVFT